MLSSRVKISCLRAKAHLVFHCCLYNKQNYILFKISAPIGFIFKIFLTFRKFQSGYISFLILRNNSLNLNKGINYRDSVRSLILSKLNTAFDHRTSKHLESRQKYCAARLISGSLIVGNVINHGLSVKDGENENAVGTGEYFHSFFELVNFDYQNVNSLCSHHHYVNSAC